MQASAHSECRTVFRKCKRRDPTNVSRSVRKLAACGQNNGWAPTTNLVRKMPPRARNDAARFPVNFQESNDGQAGVRPRSFLYGFRSVRIPPKASEILQGTTRRSPVRISFQWFTVWPGSARCSTNESTLPYTRFVPRLHQGRARSADLRR